MKRTCKITSLLLIAVMLLTLLPSVAFADPPKGGCPGDGNGVLTKHSWKLISDTSTCTKAGKRVWKCSKCKHTYTEKVRAKGHKWNKGKVTTEATCEHDGVKTYTCSRCKATRTEDIPMLGHDWDEGRVIREPSGFTPGVRTYTCKHDASHTYTEEIDPGPWLFATMEGVTVDFTTFDLATKDLTPLVITQQPVGGSITRYEDETVHLTCAATGGTGDYTYEWSYRPTYNSTIGNIISWMFLKTSGKQTQPDFDAPNGNHKYWCVVTDSAGETAATVSVEVTYKIRIADQPDNGNLQPTGKATLTCEAADGSGSYTYRWYNSDLVFQGKGASLPVSEEGDYFCTVEDNVTGETVDSEMCAVYSTDPFRLVNITESCEVLPETDTFVVASFAGGVEEYEIWWDKNGTAIDSVEGRDELDHVYSRTNVDGPGVYTVHGVDSMYATASGTVIISTPKLTIVRQPEGGTIPKDSYTRINVTVADGEAPYTYTLVRNGKNEIFATHDEPTGGFRIWYPGNYYFHIKDSKGRWIDSDIVTFEDTEFRIKSQTESGTITKPGDTVKLFVEAEGGKGSYTYLWSYKRYNTRYKVGEARTYTADKPGEYLCRVTDAEGNMIHSKPIMVDYTGDTPIITSQPTGGILKDGGSVYLSCDAVTGSGGELRFDWERTATGVRPSWSNVSRRGGSYRSWDATVVGSYRCKVTDTKTGKYTYTQVAIVEPAFEIGDITIKNSAYGYANVSISAMGGTLPYHVQIYIKYPYYDGTEKKYTLTYFGGFSANSLEEFEKNPYILDTYVKYVVSNAVTGESYYVNEYASYYIVITDSTGKKVDRDYSPHGN